LLISKKKPEGVVLTPCLFRRKNPFPLGKRGGEHAVPSGKKGEERSAHHNPFGFCEAKKREKV
jgi:hypothetical protein